MFLSFPPNCSGLSCHCSCRAQMERSWDLRDKLLLPYCDASGVCFSPEHGNYGAPAKLKYRIAANSSSSSSSSSSSNCHHWTISEIAVTAPGPGRQHFIGGTSFLARIRGEESRLCAVLNALDGTYRVVCSRPRPGNSPRPEPNLDSKIPFVKQGEPDLDSKNP